MSDPLASFRAQFAARCADAQAMLAGENPADEVRRTIHHLAGSADMFGFDEIGAVARRLDDQAHDGLAYDPKDLKALRVALAAAVRAEPG